MKAFFAGVDVRAERRAVMLSVCTLVSGTLSHTDRKGER